MKRVNIAFEPGEIVYIKLINEHGRVNYVCINLNGITYNVNYFMNGDQKNANLFEEELKSHD